MKKKYLFELLLSLCLFACSTSSDIQANLDPASEESAANPDEAAPQKVAEKNAENDSGEKNAKGDKTSETAQDLPAVPVAPVRSAVTINIDQVSEELGIPKNRLLAQTKILASFLETKRVPANVCNDEDDDSSEKICNVLDLLQNDEALSTFKAGVGRRVPIRPHHFYTQQGMGYGRLAKSISKEPASRVLVWAPRMLEITSCPRNLSAVAIRKLEGLLPQPSAKYMMEKLYEHANGCLHPEDEAYESTHFRQALLRYLWGDQKNAKVSIQRALLAKDSSEKARVLFWAGKLESEGPKRNFYWDKVVNEYALSYHALEVWGQRGIDPYMYFSRRPTIGLERKVLSNPDVDESLRWLEALYIDGRIEASQKFARWITRTHKQDLSPSNLLYVSALKSSHANALNTITFLTRQISENPAMLNQQTLKMLFPKPYFDVFDRAAPNTDTFLVLGVARQESGFDPRARSPKNAQGLLQLLPGTARVLSGKRKNNLYDSETNASLGVRFLSHMIDKFQSVELALAAYNAGPGRADEWIERFKTEDEVLFLDLIPFKETRNYVSSILRNNYWYERLYGNDPSVVAARALKKEVQRSHLVSRLVSDHTNLRSKENPADEIVNRVPASKEEL